MRALLVLLLGLGWAFACSGAEVKLDFIAASQVDLENPHDIKIGPDGKYLYVSDVGNNRIAILDPESLALVGSFGADHQSGTHDIDFDSTGRAYVADTHNNRVTVYEIDGTGAQLTGELSARVRGPEGVLAHPNGRIYVAGAWSGNLVAYADGEVVAELGGLSSPHDVELAAGGDIWLADAGNSRLLLLSPELKLKRELGRKAFDFNGVRYLDLSADGMIVAADKNNHVVKFIDASGSLVYVLGNGKPGLGEYRLTTPEGVELRGSTLWISDSGNDRIVKYRMEVN